MPVINRKMFFMQLIIGVLSLTVAVESTYHVEREPTCDCVCRDSFMDAAYTHKPLCHVISRFEKELLTVKQEIERRTVFIHDIAELKEIMEEQDDLIKTLQEQVEKLSRTSIRHEALPTPASLVMKEDYMQGDSDRGNRMKEEKELVENVSTLIAKVEEVENLTTKVQEELKSERRVRRHLEEDLNETRFSIKMLDDKLLNVTLPMDSRVTHVEEIMLSTLESMNKTLFEDHLKKLYYKVDGVVYKNETEKLDERLGQVETELMDASNSNMTLKFAEELSSIVEILSTVNQTIMEKLAEEESRLGSLENKTKKLDELQGLQDEMANLLNRTSKLNELEDQMETLLNKTMKLDEFESFQNQMETLLNKTLKLDEFESLQDQMANLLHKTTKLDEFESLQDQMTILLNATELMQTRAIDLWMDIQYVRNTTVQLEKELHDQSLVTNKTLESVHQQVSNKLQSLSVELSSLKDEVLADQESLTNLKTDVQILSADVAISENKVQNLSMASENMMKAISIRIENLTGVWDNSLSILASQIEQWKNSKHNDESSNNFKDVTQSKNTADWTGGDDDDYEVEPIRMRGKGPEEKEICDLPSNDEHLLMSYVKDNQGVQKLVFGCRPIGRYILEEGPVPLKCKDGFWYGSFPTCTPLKNETEIIALAKELKQPTNPCLKDDVDVPDITDCSYFFKCAHGRSHGRVKCPSGLHFDVKTKRCSWPKDAQCGTSLFIEAMKLADLVPTILIEPDNVDKPFGLMATNDQGHLIIYPNTNLKLHCLFPENQLGWPTWEAEQFSTGFTYPIHARTSQHRSTVEFDAITSRFSGIYTCKSPYNKKHSITMVVEDVKCPVFQVNSEQEKALTYNGHPDGGERILTTTAQFFCEGGSSIAATCLPNGNWSISAPTMEECPPKRAKIWGCDVFIKQSDDDPEVKYDNHKHEIRFSCTGNRRLVGGAVATCIHNTWTLSPFPKCK
ncbi:uncharacterized protein LOC129975712 isoform X2 [Argiope bruennichi]|nr:uncharacterized protein LOC129975712 isoform X2 [Argiope bruennichi]